KHSALNTHSCEARIIAHDMARQDRCIEGYLFIRPTAHSPGMLIDRMGNITEFASGGTSACCDNFAILEYITGTGNNRIQNVKVLMPYGMWETSVPYSERYDIQCRIPTYGWTPGDGAYLILARVDGTHFLAFHKNEGYLGQYKSLRSTTSQGAEVPAPETQVLSSLYLFAYNGTTELPLSSSQKQQPTNGCNIFYGHVTMENKRRLPVPQMLNGK
ncbi:MAG: hypothetical protein FWG73_08860, partial [Planctomycetaceae bacterium]|nr:hypothetical protein [Planctomycetaceae bacterium]